MHIVMLWWNCVEMFVLRPRIVVKAFCFIYIAHFTAQPKTKLGRTFHSSTTYIQPPPPTKVSAKLKAILGRLPLIL